MLFWINKRRKEYEEEKGKWKQSNQFYYLLKICKSVNFP